MKITDITNSFKELALSRVVNEDFDLFEVNMSPGNLQKLASNINATAGMEFEMIVPDIGDPSGGDEYEDNRDRNWDAREYFTDLDELYEFFEYEDDGVYNEPYYVKKMIDAIRDDFYAWRRVESERLFMQNERSNVREWVINNLSISDFIMDYSDQLAEAFEENELEWDDDYDYDDLKDKLEELDKENLSLRSSIWDKVTEFIIEEKDNNYDTAKDKFKTDYYEEDRFEEFQEDKNLKNTEQVFDDYGDAWNVRWPFMEGSLPSDEAIEYIVDSFGEAVGKQANWVKDYHSGSRSDGEYDVEPDSSLQSNNDDDGGLEFISHPMPLEEMMNDLYAVVEWAKNNGVYTNRTTGLHMNVSVEGFENSKLDYVKLALLIGDKHILRLFGRLGNYYSQSVLDQIRDKLRRNDENDDGAGIAEIFDTMKKNMNTQISKMNIARENDQKFSSINVKDGYVEFRSPGGNWLSGDISKVKNTLLRYVVALDAAIDEQKYRKEYLKKLYQFLTTEVKNTEDKNMLKVFVEYTEGMITRNELKSSLVGRAQERKSNREVIAKLQDIINLPTPLFYMRNIAPWARDGEIEQYNKVKNRLINDSDKMTKEQIIKYASWLKKTYEESNEIQNRYVETLLATDFSDARLYRRIHSDGTPIDEKRIKAALSNPKNEEEFEEALSTAHYVMRGMI